MIEPRLRITWEVDPESEAGFDGVTGIDFEVVPISDLVRWARMRRRRLRRAMKDFDRRARQPVGGG